MNFSPTATTPSQLTNAPNKGNIFPVGKGGDFGEAAELASYVYKVGRTENGVTKSFVFFLVRSYPRLAHMRGGGGSLETIWG